MKNNNLLNDVYYNKDYISLYLKKNESIFEFKLNEGSNFFYNISIKRPINQIGSVVMEDGYFDLESAYGYGGYYTNSQDKEFIRRALEAYKKNALKKGLLQNLFVFIRLIPFQ